MKRVKIRLTQFIFLFSLALLIFEFFIKVNGEYFYALSDKVLMKEAILNRSPDVSVLFLGTSRFVDGIAQNTFADELESITGFRFNTMNGATTGSEGDRTLYLAKLAAESLTITHVILEASTPSMQSRELGFPLRDDDVQFGDESSDQRFASRFENKLQNWFLAHISMVKYRKALRLKSFLKLPILYSANVIDPNIWARKGMARTIFKPEYKKVTEEIEGLFGVHLIKPLPEAEPTKAKGVRLVLEREYTNLTRLSKLFLEKQIEVIWVAPPVTTQSRKGNYGEKFTSLYQKMANQFNVAVYDYQGVDSVHGLFRDPTHMNSKGRKAFSVILARQLASHFSSLKK